MGFDSLSASLAQAYADNVAQQVCADDNVAGIQFDIEPFDVSSTSQGQYPFHLQIAKDFAGSGCTDAAHPQGRYFSFFTFASTIAPASPQRANVGTILNSYGNGYLIDSLSSAQADVLNWLASNIPGPGSGDEAGDGPSDTQAPTVPTGLSVSATTSSSASLTWNASTDGVGVTGYAVYRNGTKVGTTTGTSYTATGLSSSTSYQFTVSAFDAAGNASDQSAAVTATTSGPPAPPTDGANLLANPGFETGDLSGWSCAGGGAAVVSGHAASGTKSLALTPSSTQTAQCVQSVAVTPNQSYVLSAQLAGGSGPVVISVSAGSASVSSNGSGYAARSVTVTPSSNVLQVSLTVYKQQDGTAYADEVSLAPAQG